MGRFARFIALIGGAERSLPCGTFAARQCLECAPGLSMCPKTMRLSRSSVSSCRRIVSWVFRTSSLCLADRFLRQPERFLCDRVLHFHHRVEAFHGSDQRRDHLQKDSNMCLVLGVRLQHEFLELLELHCPLSYRVRTPAIFAGSRYSVLPEVTYKVRSPGPPNAQLVTRSSGIGRKSMSWPAGEKT